MEETNFREKNMYINDNFVFLDRAFSIMKMKNKPTKCTN